MFLARKRCTVLLVLALAAFALPTPAARAQTAAPGSALVDQLVPANTPAEIDLPALRAKAAERIKSRADIAPLKRPLLAPQLTKLPQFAFDVTFDPDSSLVRPASYRTIGRIADALSDPKLLHYVFLVVTHTDSNGRRDANLVLSQRRADSIREVLVSTFKISGKRLKAIGLGEEQLQDSARPTSPANLGAQIMTLGPVPVVETPAAPAAPAKKGPAAPKGKSQKKR